MGVRNRKNSWDNSCSIVKLFYLFREEEKRGRGAKKGMRVGVKGKGGRWG